MLTRKGKSLNFSHCMYSYQARIIQVVSIRSFLIREKQIPFTLVFTCHDVRSCDRGCLENSDLRPRKLRPRNMRPRKLQIPWKTIEIVNAVLPECIYFFTIIIIVTNPKCQITQQSCIDNCRQVKGFLYFYSKQKRERQEQWQNYFTFSHVISGKKRPELPGQCNDRCRTNLQATEIHAR